MPDSISSLISSNAASPVPPKDQDPKKLKESAQQFEALLIAQMMRSMRESSSGWLGTGEDSTASPAMEMAEEQFAQAMSSKGGLGLATMVSGALGKADRNK